MLEWHIDAKFLAPFYKYIRLFLIKITEMATKTPKIYYQQNNKIIIKQIIVIQCDFLWHCYCSFYFLWAFIVCLVLTYRVGVTISCVILMSCLLGFVRCSIMFLYIVLSVRIFIFYLWIWLHSNLYASMELKPYSQYL